MNGDFPAGATTPGGYNCPMCHMWVQWGWKHQCSGWAQMPWPNPPQGWSCPHCHKAHAPWVQTCPDQAAVFVTGTTVGCPDQAATGNVPGDSK